MRNPRFLFSTTRMTRVITAALILTFSVNVSLAQKVATSKAELPVKEALASVPPIYLENNPTCSTLFGLGLIDSEFGLKIDEGSPTYQNVPIINGSNPSRELMGGAAPRPDSRVSMTTVNNLMSWSANFPILAVIVKGGPNNAANAYIYDPASTGDTGLTTPTGTNAISHVIFCFGSLVPSAANASVSGRVVDSYGTPIRSASVQMWNVSTGAYHYAYTNTFGNYTFNDLPVADFYVMTANHSRYIFEDNYRSFTLDDNLSGVDFVGVQ